MGAGIKYLTTLGISLLPIFELRGAIPWGILKEQLPWTRVVLVAVIGNFLPVIPLFLGIERLAAWLGRFPALARFFGWFFERTRRRSRAVACSEFIGLAVFVGIPLPMTGAWTGAVAASLLRIPFRRAVSAVGLGILMAAAVVTPITLGIRYGWSRLSPEIIRLFIKY
ncbi:MAG TPA: small multi-drug export protein [bacterium]|uniref:Putative small multi-drug export protein n=1 Tax=candidate division TA06 bacterium ADurb.Bin417 TaxID=1852828 RepID=A0A1V5MDQ8_UNCT6|nr:MAG: putative small multi-drug export protein [candidate division TA06 bacterium ADurb.Bin417]HNQ35392.1 small multi-drug export protein [bacterium]HNS49207.1 small multi-drug export protein [bacterium]